MDIYTLSTDLQALQSRMETWAEEHEGDITEFPLLDELEKVTGDFKDKALSIAEWIINLRANAGAISDQAKALSARAKAIDNKADRIEAYLEKNIPPGQKLENARCRIGWRKSEKVVCNIPALELPCEYIRVADPTPKLDELKKALKAGNQIEGVEIITNQNIQIKP
jgi:hypothetical protein